MKKSIFLFFAAILCAMTANAQWALMGTLTDWSSGKAMTVSGTTATCTVDLAGATEYKLKVKNGGTWYGRNSTTISNTTTTSAFNTSGGDVTLKTTIPGTYTFSFDTGTKKLKVTYPEVPALHDITVRAKLPATWTSSTITAWVWTSENASGTAVTAEKDGDYYKITKNAGALYVIFRNGANWNGDKNQTVDLVYTEDVCLQLNQSGTAKATATVIDCGAVSKDITVKAVVPGAWENEITAWVWPTGGEGKEVTPTKDGNWYVVTENCIELNVIFKNGKGWNGDENQTVNIEGVSENICYQISALNKVGNKCSVTEVDCEAAIEPEAKPVDVYTIVGAETLVGTAWDFNNTDNDMTKQDDGSYVLVKENVELAKTGTYEYKVVKNRSWDWKGVNEGNNLTLTGVDVDGTYNITFTLNKELNALTASLELVEAKKVIPECYVAGDESLTGQDWNAKSVSMTYDEVTEVYTATLTAVPAGTHNMKVVYGGEWLGFDHLSTPAPANVKEGEDKKIQFTLAEAGDVTVTYHATNGIGLTGNFAEPVTYDYYLTGTLVGGWSAKQQGLEKDGELYKATFTELNAGTYQFKITDGQFNTEEDKTHEHTTLAAEYKEVSYVDGNIQFVTEEAKNIIVIFDATANKITIVGLTIVTHTYTIAGDAALCGEAWNWELAANDMTNNGDGTYTWTKAGVEVNGELSFKVFVDHKSESAYPSDNWVIKPENYEGVGVYDVTITFTESSKEIAVALTKQAVVTPTPDYTRTVTEGNYGTICLPYGSSNYAGAEFYEVSWLQKNGETPVNLYLDQLEADAQLEAGKPYIFRATSTELTVTYTGAAVDAPIPGENGLTGSFAAIPANGVLTGNYVVAQTKFWTATATAYAAENRAYINAAIVPTTEPAKVPGRRRVSLGAAGENAETGIDNIITTDTPVKVIENGQLIIIRNGEKFNVQGQKL